MRTLRAYGCTHRAGDARKGSRSAVCIVLDAAHASHTIRVFVRDQHPGGVVHPLPHAEAARLLAGDAGPEPADAAPGGGLPAQAAPA
jgi:hypothetical protein